MYLFFCIAGPLHWGNTYKACGAAKQSPIDIPEPNKLEYDSSLGPFTFTGYSDLTEADMSIKNNGHSGRCMHIFIKICEDLRDVLQVLARLYQVQGELFWSPPVVHVRVPDRVRVTLR